MSSRESLSRQPTIETVAAAAGVSTMTVSRVLRGKDNVATTTQERVTTAMSELGYVPNRLAGALASNRSTQIAVIVPTLRNAVFSEVLAGVAKGLEGSGYQSVIGVVEYDTAREYELLHSMMAWRPAAVILANLQHRRDTLRILTSTDIPVMEVMGLKRKPIDMSVGIDHVAAGSAMATHVISKGYSRFAYLGTNHDLDSAARNRFQGFCRVLKKQGAVLEASLTVPELAALSLGRRHIGPLLDAAPDAQLIYCSNDAVAAGVMMHCLTHGISVPGELAIAGYGGLEIASVLPIELTTISSPMFDVGRIGAAQVLAKLSGRAVQRVMDTGFELVEGESC